MDFQRWGGLFFKNYFQKINVISDTRKPVTNVSVFYVGPEERFYERVMVCEIQKFSSQYEVDPFFWSMI